MKKYLLILLIYVFAFLPNYTVYAGEDNDNNEKETMKSKTNEDSKKIIEVENKICPVMKGEIIEKYAVKVEYEGKIYNLCCYGCLKEFKKDPEKYIKIIEEQQKEQKDEK